MSVCLLFIPSLVSGTRGDRDMGPSPKEQIWSGDVLP